MLIDNDMSNSDIIKRRLFVGGLAETVSEDELKYRFSRFVNVSNLTLKCRTDTEGNHIKSFAHFDIHGTEESVKKCFAAYQNAKWKGCVMKLQTAKDNFIDRLEIERQEELNKSPEVPVKRKQEEEKEWEPPDFIKNGAGVPGTPVPGKKDWVVGKYGRVLPIMNVKKSYKIKAVKHDPSKFCHASKVFKEDKVDKVSSLHADELTWEIDTPDSAMTKKRKGIFPPSSSPQKKPKPFPAHLLTTTDSYESASRSFKNKNKTSSDVTSKIGGLEIVKIGRVKPNMDKDKEIVRSRFDSDYESDGDEENVTSNKKSIVGNSFTPTNSKERAISSSNSSIKIAKEKKSIQQSLSPSQVKRKDVDVGSAKGEKSEKGIPKFKGIGSLLTKLSKPNDTNVSHMKDEILGKKNKSLNPDNEENGDDEDDDSESEDEKDSSDEKEGEVIVGKKKQTEGDEGKDSDDEVEEENSSDDDEEDNSDDDEEDNSGDDEEDCAEEEEASDDEEEDDVEKKLSPSGKKTLMSKAEGNFVTGEENSDDESEDSDDDDEEEEEEGKMPSDKKNVVSKAEDSSVEEEGSSDDESEDSDGDEEEEEEKEGKKPSGKKNLVSKAEDSSVDEEGSSDDESENGDDDEEEENEGKKPSGKKNLVLKAEDSSVDEDESSDDDCEDSDDDEEEEEKEGKMPSDKKNLVSKAEDSSVDEDESSDEYENGDEEKENSASSSSDEDSEEEEPVKLPSNQIIKSTTSATNSCLKSEKTTRFGAKHNLSEFAAEVDAYKSDSNDSLNPNDDYDSDFDSNDFKLVAKKLAQKAVMENKHNYNLNEFLSKNNRNNKLNVAARNKRQLDVSDSQTEADSTSSKRRRKDDFASSPVKVQSGVQSKLLSLANVKADAEDTLSTDKTTPAAVVPLTKQEADNAKRLLAVKEQNVIRQRKKDWVKTALKNVDNASLKRIVFDSSDEDEHIGTNSNEKQEIHKDSEEKAKVALSKTPGGMNLLGDSSEDDSDGDDLEEMFKSKPQFEGEKGEELMKMQKKFGDSRFKLDAKFIDSDDDENDKGEEASMADEKKRNIQVLESVVGKNKVDKLTAKLKRNTINIVDMVQMRFDPSKMKKAQLQQEKADESSEKEKNKDDSSEAEPLISKQEQTKSKVVLSDSLVDMLKTKTKKGDGKTEGEETGKDSTFSILDMFDGEEDDDEEESPLLKKPLSSLLSKKLEHKDKMGKADGKTQIKESSDSEEEMEVETKEIKRKTVNPGLKAFMKFQENDSQNEDSDSSDDDDDDTDSCKTSNLDDIRANFDPVKEREKALRDAGRTDVRFTKEEWLDRFSEIRHDLLLMCKKRFKDARRKKKVEDEHNRKKAVLKRVGKGGWWRKK